MSLLGLLDMIGNYGFVCFHACHLLKSLQRRGQLNQPPSEKLGASHRIEIGKIARVLGRLGLPVSVQCLDALNNEWAERGFESAVNVGLLHESVKTIERELQSVTFKPLTAAEADLYCSQQPFGADVATAFPDTAEDLEEAARCLALGRATACVFHLMRAVEVGVVALGHAVGIRKHSPTWEAVLGAIDAKLNPPKGSPKKTGRWRKDEPFYAEANAHLRSLKIAVRNPTMHRGNFYTEEKAREIYDASRALYQHLATKLKQKK